MIRSGIGSLVPQVSDEMIVAAARSEEHLRDPRSLGLQLVITVPLKARGRTLGAIALLTERGGRSMRRPRGASAAPTSAWPSAGTSLG